MSETETLIQHVYDFTALDRMPRGPTSLEITARKRLPVPGLPNAESTIVGAVLTGKHIVCTLATQDRGTGAPAHALPNEQFVYILHGTMMSDIEGDRVFASKGMILHTPGSVIHTRLACPDDDLVFLAIKDRRHGIVGAPVDGKYDGPNCFAGFGSRSDEPRITLAQVLEESSRRPPGPGKRYVYDMSNEADSAKGVASAVVTPDSQLRLPPGITGKLLTGECLHVGVMRFAPGARLGNYRRDNEQFAFVVEGELEAEFEAELEDERFPVPRRCLLHMPAGVRHELAAPEGALIVMVQDKRTPTQE